MQCPKCDSKLNWYNIAFAMNPVLIKCPSCKKKLVGNFLIKCQLVLALLFGGVIGGWLAATDSFNLVGFTYALIGVFLIVVPNTYVTLKYGKYRVRNT